MKKNIIKIINVNCENLKGNNDKKDRIEDYPPSSTESKKKIDVLKNQTLEENNLKNSKITKNNLINSIYYSKNNNDYSHHEDTSNSFGEIIKKKYIISIRN